MKVSCSTVVPGICTVASVVDDVVSLLLLPNGRCEVKLMTAAIIRQKDTTNVVQNNRAECALGRTKIRENIFVSLTEVKTRKIMPCHFYGHLQKAKLSTTFFVSSWIDLWPFFNR